MPTLMLIDFFFFRYRYRSYVFGLAYVTNTMVEIKMRENSFLPN